MESSSNPLARIEAAHRLLAEARTIDEVKDVRDRAAAAAFYAKERGYSQDLIDYAQEIMVRSERKAGEILADMPKNRGARGQLTGRDSSGDYIMESPEEGESPRLSDIGVTPRQSMQWQQVAKIPEPEFERRIEETKFAGDPVTTGAVLRDSWNSAPAWTGEETEIKALLLGGDTVVINLHRHKALALWARVENRFARIDRQSDWGNPFLVGSDGDRDEVVNNYRDHYLPYKYGLLARLGELEGKALACWCAPSRCHGDVLLDELRGLLVEERAPCTTAVLAEVLEQ